VSPGASSASPTAERADQHDGLHVAGGRADRPIGFDVARKRRRRLTSVDKVNVLVVSQLWRES